MLYQFVYGRFSYPYSEFLFGAVTAEVFAHAEIYLIGSSVSYIGFAIVESICGALRGIGKTRASLTISLIMNLSYVLLNIVFIKFLDMGVLGMVIAANVSRYAAAIFALFYLAKMDTTLYLRIRDMAMATNAISASLVTLLLVPSMALSQTIVTVVGQCMGR